MACAQRFQHRTHVSTRAWVVIALSLLLASACAAQAPAPTDQQSAEQVWMLFMKNHPGLMDALIRLATRLINDVHYPPPRTESKFLALLPDSANIYVAFSNYGDVADQSLSILHQELAQSSALRDWWTHGDVATIGPKVEDALAKFVQFSQYLGPEITLSARFEGNQPAMLFATETRKPGLKKFLQQLMAENSVSSKSPIRFFDPQDLATAQKLSSPGEFDLLLRSDYIVASTNLTVLKNLNSRIAAPGLSFASTPFGQRVARAYSDGVASVAAADLHAILERIPPGSSTDLTNLRRTGFSDVKYFVAEHKNAPGKQGGEFELSFIGPRRGAAAWLAKPAPLGSLDFASPNAVMLASIRISNPAQIFDDVKDLAGPSQAGGFASLAAMEQMFKISLKDDLLSRLGGEITIEMISAAPPQPSWRVFLQVTDPAHVEQSLNSMLESTHFPVEKSTSDGITGYSLHIPSGNKTIEIVYTFVDCYWIIASSHDTLAEAIRFHKSGESLAKSKRFLDALPPGHESGVSALWFQDPVATAALQVRALAPDLAGYFASLAGKNPPTLVALYGEDTAIREANKSGAVDVSAFALIGAAVAIPNLLRAKTAANEASAVGTVRTTVIAQVTYAVTYPDKGFAPDLATLGPDPAGAKKISAAHAALLDARIADPGCKAGNWCTHDGYRLILTASCAKPGPCKDFVALATPSAANTGTKSFCATSDGIVRVKPGDPIASPITIQECQSWPPLQ
jgi:type IV pilus assembly protein PilA